MRYSPVPLALLLCCVLAGPALGKADAVTRKVSPFTAIEVAGALELDASVGKTTSLRLEGDPQAVAAVISEVVNHKLVLRQRAGTSLNWTNRTVRCVVVTPKLEALTATGACHLTAHELVGPALTLAETGASSATLSGKVAKLVVSIAGACQLDGVRLAVTDARVNASGASHAVINASKTLAATATGASEVKFAGHPKVTQSVSGASRVVPR